VISEHDTTRSVTVVIFRYITYRWIIATSASRGILLGRTAQNWPILRRAWAAGLKVDNVSSTPFRHLASDWVKPVAFPAFNRCAQMCTK
jgi:hypothetical protein